MEKDNPNPLKTVRGKCNNREEALRYEERLGEGHGVAINIIDPDIIEIRELEQGAVGSDFFGQMNQILMDGYRRELDLQKEAQTTQILPLVTSPAILPNPKEDQSYFSRVLGQFISFFRPPAQPLEQ